MNFLALFTAALRISGLASSSRSSSWLEVRFLLPAGSCVIVLVIGRRIWVAQAPAGSPVLKSGFMAGSVRMAPLWHLKRHLLFLNSEKTHMSSVVRGGVGNWFCEFCIWLSMAPASIGGSCWAEAGAKPASNNIADNLFINRTLLTCRFTLKYYQKPPASLRAKGP